MREPGSDSMPLADDVEEVEVEMLVPVPAVALEALVLVQSVSLSARQLQWLSPRVVHLVA